jgi:hypothetical protein
MKDYKFLLAQLGAYLIIVGIALLVFKWLVGLAQPQWEKTYYVGLPENENITKPEDLKDNEGIELI